MNGKRVAQLLASEVEGHEGRGLGDLAVVDADRDAEPSPEGTRAYAVAERGESEENGWDEGEQIAVVDIYPAHATLEFERNTTAALDTARERGLDVESGAVVLPDGASVKRALVALAEA